MRRQARDRARTAIGAVLAAILLAPAAPIRAAGEAAAGQALYQAKCGGCHSLEANRIGPAHRGVVGRKIASAPGFAYSPAIRKLTGIWTTTRLDQWLQGPQKMAPGSKMYLNVPDPAQRAEIIAWLAANPARR
jgi:cytochrome c